MKAVPPGIQIPVSGMCQQEITHTVITLSVVISFAVIVSQVDKLFVFYILHLRLLIFIRIKSFTLTSQGCIKQELEVKDIYHDFLLSISSLCI